MTKRAKALTVGDVLADYGAVTAVAIHRPEKRPGVSTVGFSHKRRVIAPPIQMPRVAVVVIRAEQSPHPIYRWPNDPIELAA
jgi:hypothetical protein